MYSFHNFAPIGKAVLHRLVGVRDNYVSNEMEIPTECKSHNCEYAAMIKTYQAFPNSIEYQKALDVCKTCDHCYAMNVARTKVKKIYMNEMNRFGSSTPLKLTAILLFIAYHMLCDQKYGMIRGITIRELKNILGCSEHAIRYNQELLSKHGYITVYHAQRGYYNILINDYTTYFRNASNGGRGFYTLTPDLFQALLNLNHTNEIRIILKLLLDHEQNILNDRPVMQSYQDLQSYLPDYCKRNVIQKTLNSLKTGIVSVVTFTDCVRFSLNKICSGRQRKELLAHENENKLRTFVDQFNTNPGAFFKLPSLHDPLKSPPILQLDKDKIRDLVRLSLEYTIDHVIQALQEVYCNYILEHRHIRNFAGLVRQTISNFITHPASSLNFD